MNPSGIDALAAQIVEGVVLGGEEKVADVVRQNAVDFLGHRAIKRSQSRLDMGDRNVQLRRGERGGERRIHIPRDDHEVRLAIHAGRLEGFQNRGGLRAV